MQLEAHYILLLIKDIVYQSYQRGIRIAFMWIPSHRGIFGNETADKTAYEGVNALDVRNVIKVPMADYHCNMRQTVNTSWLSLGKMIKKLKKDGMEAYKRPYLLKHGMMN